MVKLSCSHSLLDAITLFVRGCGCSSKYLHELNILFHVILEHKFKLKLKLKTTRKNRSLNLCTFNYTIDLVFWDTVTLSSEAHLYMYIDMNLMNYANRCEYI